MFTIEGALMFLFFYGLAQIFWDWLDGRVAWHRPKVAPPPPPPPPDKPSPAGYIRGQRVQ